MKQDLFWPIYQQLETELRELSLYIHIDKKQLTTYSIKIADLILRAVSECENISKELCKNNSIRFLDKKRRVRKFVNFHEYIKELEKKYGLSKKVVTFEYNNADYNFDTGRMPFKKTEIKLGKKTKELWTWHHSYNLVKHDRIKNYRKANLVNLIDAMAALFLLNIYYKDEKFYEEKPEDAISKIRSFSDVFYIRYIVNPERSEEICNDEFGKSIYRHARIERLFSTYMLEFNKTVKTSSDEAQDLMDLIQISTSIKEADSNQEIHIDNRSVAKVYAYPHSSEK